MGTSFFKTAVIISCVALTSIDLEVSARSWLPTTKLSARPSFIDIRGGEASAATTDEPSLDDKVDAAMKKLGISPPEDDGDCKDGVCPIPGQPQETTQQTSSQDPHELAAKISKDMNVDVQLVMAAIGATATPGKSDDEHIFNEQAARDMVQTELDLINSQVPEDSPNVKALVEDGFDSFLSRRALAFAENNMEDARAILIADQMDQEEEEKAAKEAAAAAAAAVASAQEDDDEEAAMRAQLRAEQQAAKSKAPDMVEVKTNFDPTALPATSAPKPKTQQPPAGMPKPAAKETVVFEATTAQLQELVLESPVPVLLDVYADWCGECNLHIASFSTCFCSFVTR